MTASTRDKDSSRDCGDPSAGCSGGEGGCDAASESVPSTQPTDGKTGLLSVDSVTTNKSMQAVVVAANRQKFGKMLPVGLPANRPVDITANGPTRVPLSQRRNPPAKLNLTLDLSVSI